MHNSFYFGDGMEKIWHHTFYDELRSKEQKHVNAKRRENKRISFYMSLESDFERMNALAASKIIPYEKSNRSESSSKTHELPKPTKLKKEKKWHRGISMSLANRPKVQNRSTHSITCLIVKL